ncbi:ATP-binding cassette domain-containing protein, partial [Bradyrhizobium sp. NBAIM08]|uniref:ATP-binding cassette domain-containing protein n=1 Tax=Bradyrhizobium sp. NBAIM08 TaxID=2793815 RepID=UPI001CD74481
TDLAMMAGVATRCEACEGKRFQPMVLEYLLDGKNIAEVLAMSVSEAREFFGSGPAHAILARMDDVGLGYIGIGQPLTTLSGGERQRLKLAISMADKGGLYVLDEPSIGLHQRDNRKLLTTLGRLRDLGNTVVVVEHDEETIRAADYVVDLGPGAGELGG